jgi:hypothetical protein
VHGIEGVDLDFTLAMISLKGDVTGGEFECGVSDRAQNTRLPVETGQNRSGQPHATDAANTILPL